MNASSPLTATLGEIAGLVIPAPRLKVAPRPRDTKKDEKIRTLLVSNHRLTCKNQTLRNRIRELEALLADKPNPRTVRRLARVAKGLCATCPNMREPERADKQDCLACMERGRKLGRLRDQRLRHPCADCPALIDRASSRCRRCAPLRRERIRKAIRDGKWTEPA